MRQVEMYPFCWTLWMLGFMDTGCCMQLPFPFDEREFSASLSPGLSIFPFFFPADWLAVREGGVFH
ncbi:hypothetical protein K432DRAFT_186446 [Lepidopterella palustris CBS 459.81]|uniref:Secreted protein n=1 Tax=Lepidopterella palustris CBS 459.81 TaxID=1314670 RepID=A0A8E2EL84_9PEZI|nr:hypothetical protein K432DRAFT_186446 [Lepidopterella palustris CBS 459.81]